MARIPEKTRERILGAAQECFARHGLKKTTVDDIALAAGVGKGTVYLHFHDKDDVFMAVLEARVRALNAAAVAGLEAGLEAEAGAGALPRLSRMLRNTLTFLEQDPLLAGLMQMDPGTAPADLAPFIARCHADAAAMVEGVLREGVVAGEIRPVNTRLLAFLLFALYQAYYFGPGRALAEPAEFLAAAEGLVERGIGRDGSGKGRG